MTAIVKAVNAQREKAERMKNNPRPTTPTPNPAKRDDRFRNETEVFLEEIGRRRTGQANPQAGKPGQAAGPTVAQAMATQSPQRRQPPERVGEKPRGTSRRQPIPKRSASDEASNESSLTGSKLAGRTLAASRPPAKELGGDVRKHLAEYLDPNRLSQQVKADLGNKVEEEVRTFLGRTVTGDSPLVDSSTGSKPHPVIALLHDSDGVRNAIIINEVLGRPKSLRKR